MAAQATSRARRSTPPTDELREARRRADSYALIFELLTELAVLRKEQDVIDRLLVISQELFAPTTAIYWAMDEGRVSRISTPPDTPQPPSSVEPPSVAGPWALSDDGRGFRLRLEHRGELVGVLDVASVTLPIALHQYMGVGQALSTIAGLAISNARAYEALDERAAVLGAANERLEAANASLADALQNVKRLGGLLPICCHCRKIRDDKGYWSQVEQYLQTHAGTKLSHGICPDCMTEHYGHLMDEPSQRG